MTGAQAEPPKRNAPLACVVMQAKAILRWADPSAGSRQPTNQPVL